MMSMLNIHPRDLSALLSGLVEKSLLHQEGSGRGTIYFLTEARLDDAFNTALSHQTPQYGGGTSYGDGSTFGGLGATFGGLGDSSGGLERLREIAEPISSRKRAPREEVESAILEMCRVQPCTLELLTQLLKRSDNVIRKDYLQPLIKEKRLRYLYPTMPQHPEQAYVADVGGE